MFVKEKSNWLYRKNSKAAFVFLVILTLFFWGCGKQETISFTGEIEAVSENMILVNNIDSGDFDKANVAVGDAEYDFEPEEGQLVEVTALPEIRESDPVQVTAVKLVLKKDADRKISDYFPIEENTRYVYEGSGNEYASYETYNDYTAEGMLQQMVSNGGTVSVRVYELEDGKLIRKLSRGEVYYRENLMDQADDIQEILLMEPIEEGTSWTLKNGNQRTITKINAEVKTPMGTYKAVEVLTEGEEGTNIDYYAKKIGLIKTLYQTGGLEVSSTLKSIETNASRNQEVRFYYPDAQSGKPYFVNSTVSFQTNDSTAQVLEKGYKDSVNKSLGVVLTTEAAIKSLTLDDKNTVRIDMNEAFQKEMNAGAGYEDMILRCIATTFGHYYGSDKVLLTVEGKPYESGHIKLEEGETLSIFTEEIEEKS